MNELQNLEWLTDALAQVNYWSVLVATLAVLLWGMIWYAPSVMGENWLKHIGLKPKDLTNPQGRFEMFLGAFVFTLFGATFLQAVMVATNTAGLINGALLGAVFGLVFTAMPIAAQNLFGRKDIQLSAIQGADAIVAMALMGAIFGFWQ